MYVMRSLYTVKAEKTNVNPIRQNGYCLHQLLRKEAINS